MSQQSKITLISPAKVNLFLLIEGLRPDGFHDLMSVVSPISLVDELTIHLGAVGKPDSLKCEGIVGDIGFMADNYVLKATRLFRERVKVVQSIHFDLKKSIPISAGLGGGSSNAVAALKGLNQLLGDPLTAETLFELSLSLGSDCPFFLKPVTSLMRGRGEDVTPMMEKYQRLFMGRRLLIFKPEFPISTPWAYSKIKEQGVVCYQTKAETEAFYKKWLADLEKDGTILLNNTFERVVFEKYLAIPELLESLNQRFKLECSLSGSGSACFALLEEGHPVDAIRQVIQEAWGDHTPVHECTITA